jgi:hypothetical protein
LRIRIDRGRHAADQEALQMRVLAAEDGVDLDEAALPVERFQIVRDGHEIGLRRQLVGRMTPIGIREGPELAALDKGLHAVAHAGKILGARQRPIRDRLRQRRSFRRVRAERADDVDPIERVQVIEMDDVILHVLRRYDQIAEQPCVRRGHGADSPFDCADRGDGVNRGADAADALGEGPGVARIAPAQDQLDAAKHRGR